MRGMIERYLHGPRDGEGGGGGGGGGDGQQQQQPPAFNYPANLPAHFKADTPEATMGKLLDAYLPARDALGKVPKAPDKAELYELALEGSLAGYSDTLKTDPLMPKMREIAHKNGMSKEQFQNVFGGIMSAMHDMGAFAPMPSDDKIAGALVDPALEGLQRGEAVTAAMKRLTDARAWVDGLGADKSWNAHERAELAMMVNSAGGVSIIERLQKATNQATVQPGGASDPIANMQSEYEKRLNDPRNNSDAAFATATRELSKKIAAARRGAS